MGWLGLSISPHPHNTAPSHTAPRSDSPAGTRTSVPTAEPGLESPCDVSVSAGSLFSTRKGGTSCNPGAALHRSPPTSAAAQTLQAALQKVGKIQVGATVKKDRFTTQPTRMLSARDFRVEQAGICCINPCFGQSLNTQPPWSL